MRRGTTFVLTIILTDVKTSGLLPSTLKFCKRQPSFLFCFLDFKKQIFHFYLVTPELRWKMQRCDQDQRLQRKIGSPTRFEEMEIDIKTCFPGQVVVFVSLEISSRTQTDSMPNVAIFFESFCWLVYLIPKESSLSKSFAFDVRSLDFFRFFLFSTGDWVSLQIG